MAHRPKPKSTGKDLTRYNKEHAAISRKKKANQPKKLSWTERLDANRAAYERSKKESPDGTEGPKDDKDERLIQTANLAKGIKLRREKWMQQEAPWGRYPNGQPKPQPSATEQLQIQKKNNSEETNKSSETKTEENKKEPKISERQQRIKKLEELSKTDRNYIPTSMDVESGATGGAKTWKQSQQYKKYQRMLRKLREDEKKGG